jgi:uncharacterized Zn-finger protein
MFDSSAAFHATTTNAIAAADHNGNDVAALFQLASVVPIVVGGEGGQIHEAADLLSRDAMLITGGGGCCGSDLIELTRLIDLETNHPPQQHGLGSNLTSSTSSSGTISRDGSVWSSSGAEDDERDNAAAASASEASGSSATVAHHLMSNLFVDLNCNDENFSCFNESILFGGEEDELQHVEEVQATTTTFSKEQSAFVQVTDLEALQPQQPFLQSFIRDPKTKQYHCPHCEKSFQYSSRLQRHLTAHQQKQFRCEICDKFFSRGDVLASHRTKVHGESTTTTNTAPSPVISATSSSSSSANFPCPDCPAQLKSRHHLQRHLRAHLDRVGHFKCEHCAKEFSVKHKYQRHLRLHLGEKRFVCAVCGRAFLQNEFLARHLLTHSGATPFDCPACGRAFNQLANLRQHQERVHRVEGRLLRHECKVCDKVSENSLLSSSSYGCMRKLVVEYRIHTFQGESRVAK